MKIGIIKEGKNPPDSRVVLTPEQCVQIKAENDIEIVVESSKSRCFRDEAYSQKGIKLVKNVADCDVLLGVKEVPIQQLISNKTYFFFSHTIKEQPYNRKLLQEIIKKKIRLIDYEVLTDDNGARVIAFGRFAGMVGAHNALLTYGLRTKAFELDRMISFDRFANAKEQYENTSFPNVKVVVTGLGRVANGACEVLYAMGFKRVTPSQFIQADFDIPVFTQIGCLKYAVHKTGQSFKQSMFFKNPEEFKSNFHPFAKAADIFINGIYWDPRAPAFFTKAQMKSSDFNIKVIADVTCDIAPEASIPSTLRSSTIADPIYGYNPHTEKEQAAFQEDGIDIMAVDNLPNELPKDASQAFGEQFIEFVLPNLLQGYDNEMMQKASITFDGDLGAHFEYLRDYVNNDQ